MVIRDYFEQVSESCKQLRLPFSVTMKTSTHVWTEKPFRLSRCVKDHAFLSSGKNNTLSLKPVESCVRYRLSKTGRDGRGRVAVHISALPSLTTHFSEVFLKKTLWKTGSQWELRRTSPALARNCVLHVSNSFASRLGTWTHSFIQVIRKCTFLYVKLV